jgi:putative membrane-bound dehydrogenase-like protein
MMTIAPARFFRSSLMATCYGALVKLLLCQLIIVSSTAISLYAVEPAFFAGAAVKNIDPKVLPVWTNGGITARQVDRVTDALFARTLVLGDGTNEIAICIVDNCILPLSLVDRAKTIIQERTGLAPASVLIAATHTHSAVSVDGAHGTPVQEDYATELPSWIAESVFQAKSKMVPAKWGVTVTECDDYIFCRDWLMKPGHANTTRFTGRESNSVSMNPGHDNPNKIAPVGTIDRVIPILSIQDLEGRPISILASFCTHYAGAPNLSSDYFGVVCDTLAKKLMSDSSGEFVGLMANATSGNANCVDYSRPKRTISHVEVGNFVANRILNALPNITYRTDALVGSVLESIELNVRMPSAAELSEAKAFVDSRLSDRLPSNIEENYARETVLLSELPSTRRLNLQALRIDDFVIAANPCESYNETGLKLRQSSPFRITMNIGLANGHAGYIPPPEMFQLGGYTTWRCRTSCLEEQAEPKMVEGLVRVLQSAFQKTRPTVAQAKPISPVSPKETLNWFELEPGFQIQLVASEPQIVDPVSMQIDEQGRMWVVEMRDYPSEDASPKSRIVVLEDIDRDGFYEKSTVFADKLLFATGVQPWQDGALVTVQGKLLMLRDTDGDGRSDKQETWLEGFSEGNPQLRANHPVITADGWLWIASGLRGGKISSSLPFAKEQVKSLDLTGADLRVHLLDGRVEAVAGPTQFGHSFDWQGNRVGCSNRKPGFEILVDRNDLALSPLAGIASPLHDVSPGEADSQVYPLVQAWTTSNLHAGQFTAACGTIVTHSSHFDAPYATLLTCEPTGGLVQRKKIVRSFGKMTALPNEAGSGTGQAKSREWLASHDPWFRPVDLVEGPNGDIYVIDMYRAVIEHPEWVPVELKNRPDQRLGDSHGRIYRVARNPKSSSWPLQKVLTKSEVVNWLKSPNTWQRNIAAKKILENAGPSTTSDWIDPLKSIVEDPSLTAAQVAASLDLLVVLRKLPDGLIEQLLSSDSVDRRTIAWKTLRKSTLDWHSRWNSQATKCFSSSNASEEEMRAAAWFIASQSNSISSIDEPLVVAAAQQRRMVQPHTWMALSAACRAKLPLFLDSIPEESVVDDSVITKLATKVAEQLPSEELNSRVERLSKQLIAKLERGESLQSLPRLEGMIHSSRATIPAGSSTEELLLRLANSETPVRERRKGVALLAHLRSDRAKSEAMALLASPDPTIQKAAIKTCSVHDTPEFTTWLLDQFASSLPETRQEIFVAIRNHPRRLSQFLDRMESGKLSLRLLDAAQVQSLKSTQEKSLHPRIEKMVAASIQSNRQSVIDEYMKSMQSMKSSTPEQMRTTGMRVFEKSCAACHRLNNTGLAVGPDVSDSRDQTFEKLLVAVLDPNRSIDANYFRYLVRTEDGRILEGLLRDVNSQTVTIANQTGSAVVDRSQIEELKSSGMSLMPEGFEAQIGPDEMNALLWYIKNWRYALENIPANAELPVPK